jgi:predicted nucleic acid-binding protein
LVALDTNVFIYHLEANPLYVSLTTEVFDWLVRPGNRAITSTLTMAEVLVQPYREANEGLHRTYYGLLSQYPNLEWIPPDLHIAEAAARLRATYRLRTPDAIHVATAIRSGASGFLSNDAAFIRVADIEIGILDTMLIRH